MTKILPFEILKQVFSNLVDQRSDLVERMSTNRKWNRAAVEILYENIKLDDFQKNESAKNLIEMISYHPLDIAKIVRNIDVGYNMCLGDEQHSVAILKAVYEHCPNIQSLFSDFAGVKEIYWKLTLEAAKKGNLKHLEMVPVVHTPYFLELYYLPLVQEIGTQLDFICVIDTTKTNLSTSSNMSDTFHSLFVKTDFSKLEGIIFAWNNGISLTDCEHIVNCGGRSKKFRALMLKINITIDRRTSYDTYSHLILNFPTTDITVLNFEYQNFIGDVHMIYMMRKFPSLEILSLYATFFNTVQPILPSDIITEQVLISFFKFISRIPRLSNLDFGFMYPNGYWFFLDSLLTREDVDELELEYESLGEQEAVQASTCTFNPKKIQLNYKIDNSVRCKIKVNINIDSLRLLEDNRDKVYFFLSLKEGGSKIKSLTLKSMESVLLHNYVDWFTAEVASSTIIDMPNESHILGDGFWFEYVLSHCPALKSFTIIDPGKIEVLDSFNPQKHDSIEQLTVRYSSLKQEHFTFPYISKVFPALKFLSIFDYEHRYSKEQLKQIKDEQRVIKIHLPDTSLEVFTWGAENFSFSSQSEEHNTTTYFTRYYLNIKVFGKNEDFYYEINGDKITPLPKQSYHEEIGNKKQDDERLLIEICCTKIAQFRLAFNDSSGKTFDINF